MRSATLETLAWVLIFGGGLAVPFGLSLFDFSAGAGRTVTILGGTGIAAGVLLIWLRSRRSDAPPNPDRKGTP